MYKATIGIEVHVELNSNLKVFSKSKNEFDITPNSNVNLIDIAYPGTLPQLNYEIISKALMVCLALNCKINKVMNFDRKNYFYIDNPKNFQITQDKTPIGYDGYLEILSSSIKKNIDIERIHIEEDTAKSIHALDKTFLNYNRAGVPLIEIVTKPVMNSAEEACLYVSTLREVLQYLCVSDVKMEEGSMRCDINISLSKDDTLGTKVEIKNIGSISEIGISIDYEIERQTKLLLNNELVVPETRRYDSKTKSTVSMRKKALVEFNYYRYHREPDIPTIILTDEEILSAKERIGLLPSELRCRFSDIGLNSNLTNTLISNLDLCKFYVDLINTSKTNNIIAANILCGVVKQYLNESSLRLDQTHINLDDYILLINELSSNKITNDVAKKIILVYLQNNINMKKLIDENSSKNLLSDEDIEKMIESILIDNEKSIVDYKNGLDKGIKNIMGQIMKQSKGSINPRRANEILLDILKKY